MILKLNEQDAYRIKYYVSSFKFFFAFNIFFSNKVCWYG